jgi:hypothetical protein
MIFNLQPSGVDAGIAFLAYSVLVITAGNTDMELLILSNPSLTAGSSASLAANSTLFDFGPNATIPHATHFFQWLTGLSGSASNNLNYSSSSSLSLSANSTGQ